jgi:outer membrane protein assembly factor BamB
MEPIQSRRMYLQGLSLVCAGSFLLLPACDLFSSGDGEAVEISWQVDLPTSEAQWQGRPGLANGMVIAQTGGSLTAFDLDSGHQEWKRVLRQGLAIGADNVVVSGGRAFAAGADSVYAVNAVTGQRLWTFLPDAQAALCESFADDQAVYVGTRSMMVYALSADSGKINWVVNIGSAWADSGIVRGIGGSGDTIYVGAVQNLNPSGGLRTAHIIALNRNTGQELWRYIVPGNQNDVNSAPQIVGDLLLWGDLYGSSFFALNRFTEQEVWRVPTAAGSLGVSSAPVHRGGKVYAAAQGGVYAVSLATGQEVWSKEELSFLGGTDAAFCGSQLLLQNLRVMLLRISDGTKLGGTLEEDDGVHFPTSSYTVSGGRAFVVGNTAAYGLVCKG